ncbi:MAG: glutamate--cysteine ligase [Gammaproteobacteria bacterium]|nr:glutamate--cysteine ligase [Gammaproteobacteria bacterium]
MGQDIASCHFKQSDFEQFSQKLSHETTLLREWFDKRLLSSNENFVGFELEAWLIKAGGQPAPVNESYLSMLDDNALFSPELSQFNIELNSTPRHLSGDLFSAMKRELDSNWGHCREVAQQIDTDLAMIGTLPTLDDNMLTLEHMSQTARYQALNEQVLRMRQGRPIELDINGIEHLSSSHKDVMLEAATTSFQIHLQVSRDKALRYYNAMQALSAPLVAMSGNSPILFGKKLWQETRIPIFEQAVPVGGINGAAFGPLKRVSFGTGYARHSLMELFDENEQHFPVMLPETLSDDPAELSHLRLHNGTIWRWNRPLIGFDGDGTPHLRIEHRVMPAGPTTIDTIANCALFIGLSHYFAEMSEPIEAMLDFSLVRDNFYLAAKRGLKAQVSWLRGESGRADELLQHLIPLARLGLERLECSRNDIDDYISVIEGRVAKGQTGAVWQLNYLEANGGDLEKMFIAYLQGQNSGNPVHEWKI